MCRVTLALGNFYYTNCIYTYGAEAETGEGYRYSLLREMSA
jgi:hypothetical protein